MEKCRRAIYQRHIDELKPLTDQDIQKCRDCHADGTRPPEALITTLREHWQRIVELFCVLYTRDETGGTEDVKSE